MDTPDTPHFSDAQIEWLVKNLTFDASLHITPPQDGYHDPLNQMPPTIGIKVSAALRGRPSPITTWSDDGVPVADLRSDTPLGQWGWVLNTEKADELRHWATYRYQVPKGRVDGSLTRLVEGMAPEPS